MFQLIIETIVLIIGFLISILMFVAKDRKGGLHWYPKHFREAAVKRGLTSNEQIQKRGKTAKIGGTIIYACIVLTSVFVLNQVHSWKEAFCQISFMALVLNWFDAVFVDYIWVRKTKYWIIPELEDVPDLGKPVKQILKERIIASVVLIIVAAILACVIFLRF